MKTITDLRTWKSSINGEFRVYVTYDDGTEGCFYKTGNKYNEKGSMVNMSIEEKNQAIAISESKHGKGTWGPVRYWEINPATSKVVHSYNLDEEDADVKSRGFRESHTPDFEQCYR